MKRLFGQLLSLGLLLGGCQSDDLLNSVNTPKPSSVCPLCGTWNYSGYEQRATNDYVSVYTRADDFTNQAGIKFFPDGQFVERANSGWCGTPPISYADYKGSWRPDGDSLAVDSRYWGGNQRSKIAIVSVTNNQLVISRVHK